MQFKVIVFFHCWHILLWDYVRYFCILPILLSLLNTWPLYKWSKWFKLKEMTLWQWIYHANVVWCNTYSWHVDNFLTVCEVLYGCDRKDRATSAQSFTLQQQATTEVTRRDHSRLPLIITFNRSPLISPEIIRHAHSIIVCSRHIYTGAILREHPVRGESRIQHDSDREVAKIQSKI